MTTTTTTLIPAFVTADWLRGIRACDQQVKRFEAEWPDGAELTPANLDRAAEIGLPLDWLATRGLPDPDLRTYRTAANVAWDAFYREVGYLPSADPVFVAAVNTYRLRQAAALASILCPEA